MSPPCNQLWVCAPFIAECPLCWQTACTTHCPVHSFWSATSKVGPEWLRSGLTWAMHSCFSEPADAAWDSANRVPTPRTPQGRSGSSKTTIRCYSALRSEKHSAKLEQTLQRKAKAASGQLKVSAGDVKHSTGGGRSQWTPRAASRVRLELDKDTSTWDQTEGG